jgi:hypothetical protein
MFHLTYNIHAYFTDPSSAQVRLNFEASVYKQKFKWTVGRQRIIDETDSIEVVR